MQSRFGAQAKRWYNHAMVKNEAREPLTIHLEGGITPGDKSRSDYALLPFSVPPGASRLCVRYAYTDPMSAAQTEEQGNVVDIGIFDPRGSAFLRGKGFRGWSGSARRSFCIGPTEATPGYLPGPILPGRWDILLGLYRIAPQGCRYDVTITVEFESPASPAVPLPPVEIAPTSEERWYRGDLHTHTFHSDATGSLADLVSAARARGLEYVAVTDHNTISHIPHLAQYDAPGFLLIPGEEVTTYYGHANVWGLESWQEFRCRSAEDMLRVREAVREAGGLFSINHPKRGGPPWEYDLFDQADCLEVWQSPWFLGNHESLALWDRLLHQGLRLVAVGGSDRHQPPFDGHFGVHEVGHPTTWVYATRLSADAILAGIQAGHVMISADVQGPRLYLEADGDGDGRYEAMMGDELHVPTGSTIRWRCRVESGAEQLLHIVSSDRDWTQPVDGVASTYTWETKAVHDSFCRAELIIPDETESDLSILLRAALSNPIYVSVASDDGQS